MKFINRRTHAVLDYIVGIILIDAPWLFHFSADPAAKWTAIVFGVLMILTAVMTDYEGGISRQLSMSAHLRIDAIAGILLAVSPWVLGFHEQVYLPHVIVGAFELCAALCTKQKSRVS